MDLIIKPTQRCNFRCEFCSSSKIDSSENTTLPLESIFSILKQNKVNTIIVNGGDPLLMDPFYYWNIINYLENNNMDTILAFTTNLLGFYMNPDKWEDLFKHDKVSVTTSFQYGNERKLANGTVFTEELFRAFIKMFKKYIGYVPMFISVITKNNENDVIKTVKLAKELGTICKINPAFKSGRSLEAYPLWKAYQKYLDIIDAGLAKYEYNSQALIHIMHGEKEICPYNRNCWKEIRAISPNGLIHSCGAFNDDHISNKENGDKTYCLSEYDAKELLVDYRSLKPQCFACDLFPLCNSCFKHIHDIKSAGEEEIHCKNMMKLLPRFKAL